MSGLAVGEYHAVFLPPEGETRMQVRLSDGLALLSLIGGTVYVTFNITYKMMKVSKKRKDESSENG